MWSFTVFFLIIVFVLLITYLSLGYRKRWQKEMIEFETRFADLVTHYPYSKNIIWLNAPASIFWDSGAAEVCVLCITTSGKHNPLFKSYATFFLNTNNWRWHKGPPPGDEQLMKDIIADIIAREDHSLPDN